MYAELHIRTITEIYGFIGVMVTCKAEKEKGVLQSDLHTFFIYDFFQPSMSESEVHNPFFFKGFLVLTVFF